MNDNLVGPCGVYGQMDKLFDDIKKAFPQGVKKVE